MANYLKKERMYEMLKTLVDGQLKPMKSASYRFYHDSEWLKCFTEQEELYELYHDGSFDGSFVSLDISVYDELLERYVEIERITYRFDGEHLTKIYQRSESHRKVTEMSQWLAKRA